MTHSPFPLLRLRPSAFLVPALAFLLTACGSDGVVEEGADTVADTVVEDTVVEVEEPPAAAPVVGDDTVDGGDELGNPDSGDGAVGSGEVRTSELNPPGWTLGRIEVGAPGRGEQPVVATVREARHDGFDRLVVEFENGVPAYDVEYVDRPLHECGSGRQIHPVGDAWLRIRLSGARGHTEAGESRLEVERETPELTRGMRLYRTCDFEGEVVLVLAVDSPERFRAFDLGGPPRVVVDVRH